MASMRNWLKDAGVEERVAVIHCKAGKGRSGTVTCSYLISVDGWTMEDALSRFTVRRMRPGFGNGVSIPSQLRWVGYVDRWTKCGKKYLERPVEILEIHAWGLKDGVKMSIAGFVDEGRIIKKFHTFTKNERIIVDGSSVNDSVLAQVLGTDKSGATAFSPEKDLIESDVQPSKERSATAAGSEPGGKAVIFKPIRPVILPTSDVCIDLERRNNATYGWTMITAVAHVWFNAFFEGLEVGSSTVASETSRSSDEGVFQIQWEAMDGIKGSSRKGTRALDHLAVVWKAHESSQDGRSQVIEEPKPGQPVTESMPADWRTAHHKETTNATDLGLRAASPEGDVSKANSMKSVSKETTIDEDNNDEDEDEDEELQSVQPLGPEGERHIPLNNALEKTAESTSRAEH